METPEKTTPPADAIENPQSAIQNPKSASPARTIDLRGEICPYTFIKSKLAMEELALGDVLEVILNHLPAVENVPRSLENEGHEILSVAQIGGPDWSVKAKKK